MRTVTVVTTLYTFGELTQQAQQKAVEDVRDKLNSDWWDEHSNQQLRETIVYCLADWLRSPGYDKYGEGDFPGIDGVELIGWDLERGESLEFKGKLDRDNAPFLPWIDGLHTVQLGEDGTHSSVYVEADEDIDTTLMRDAVDNAISAAWHAGRRQMDYMESEEHARDYIEGTEPEFTVDGNLYTGPLQDTQR